MKCILCNKTSIEVKIDLFPLSPEARKMLLKQFGINPDHALTMNGVCSECLALPLVRRKKLAEIAIEGERDEFRRALIGDTLRHLEN
jgi:hypothetical protein